MRTHGSGALLLSILTCALLRAAPVRAEEPDVAPEAGAAEEPALSVAPHWYGGRVLLADGVSLALLAGGAAARLDPVAVVGFAGWFLAAPIVHGSHAGVSHALGSLALRVGLPLVGLAIGQAASDGCWRQPGASDTCDVAAGMTGLLLGVVAAEILDVAWLARDAHPVAPSPSANDAARTQLVLAPQTGGAMLGLAGRF
jgi:hypothetical protein